MDLLSLFAKLRHALRDEEPAYDDHRDAERKREEREEAAFDLLKAEASERRIERQAENRYRKRTLRWTGAAFFVSFITMGAVIYYAGVAYQQWQTAERTLDINERAWLIGSYASIGLEADKKTLVITTKFTNAGKSPAFRVRHNVGITGVLVAPSDDAAFKEGEGSQIALPPAGVVTTTTPRPDVTPQQLELIFSGKAAFFVWLRVTYTDPFSGDSLKNARDTLECWRYDALMKGMALCPSGQYHR